MAQSSPLAIRSLAPPLYRPRQPQNSALYQLLEAYYEDVKAMWEDRFEKKYGFWRGFVDAAVARYLDCGVADAGFARLQCDACGSERLLTLSCKQRGICPSCDAKRAAAFAAFLKDELLENVGHHLWTFTLPKMLRPYFMRQRELLGDLARLAYETIKELMLEAAGDPSRPSRSRCGPTNIWKCSQPTRPRSLPGLSWGWGCPRTMDPCPLYRYHRRGEVVSPQDHSLAEEQRPFE